MKKGLLWLLFVAYGAMTVCGQVIDHRLTNLVPRQSRQIKAKDKTVDVIDTAAVKRRINVKFNSDGTIDSIYAIAHLTPGAPCPTEQLEARGIRVKLVVGQIAILSMKPENLYELEDVENIERVDVDQMNHVTSDIARSKMEVTAIDGTDPEAWIDAGFSGTGYYTGKGVVVGVVDRGIEFNHISFLDNNGTTRVKQVMTGYPNLYVYTEEDISYQTTDDQAESHGTHVATIAAGSVISSYAKRDVRGMAPEADLVLCGLGSYLSDSRAITGIYQVFGYADEVGKPAVVNLSIGESTGMKDEENAIAKAVREMTEEGTKPGRIAVFAAANYGGDKMSIAEQLPAAGSDGYRLRTLITSIYKTTLTVDGVNYDNTYCKGIETYAYAPEGEPFTCDLKVVDTATGEVYTLAEKPLYKYVNSRRATKYTSADSFVSKKIVNGKHTVQVLGEGDYFFKEDNLSLALFIDGTEGQTINIMCDCYYNELSDGGFADYTEGNGVLSINNSACNDAVISVGAYASRTKWETTSGYKPKLGPPYKEDVIGNFSSYGTDDNGIDRPDILAPGIAVLSAYNAYDSTIFTAEREPQDTSQEGYYATYITDCITKNGTKYYYGMMGGTSMATPCVSGIIALWLQQDPTLSTIDIRNLLRATADNDEYTTNVENIPSGSLVQAGMGKINALKGMQQLALPDPTKVSAPLIGEEQQDAFNGKWSMVNGQSNKWYTIDGRQLTGKPRQKGIYLYAGKKFVIK